MNIFEIFNKDSRGVSSILGEILIAAIFVIAITTLLAVVTENDKPAEPVRTSTEEWINTTSNTIYVRHAGGEPIDIKNLKINVIINSTTYEYSSNNISQNLGGKTVWVLSDIIKINTMQTWGVGLSDEKDVTVIVIDTEKKEVLPKYRTDVNPISGSSSSQTSQTGGSGPVVADFDAIPPSGEVPLSVSFTDKSRGSPTSWRWDFGDNSSISTLRNPTHEFTTPGIYNVTLMASKPGSSSTKTKSITVTSCPVANFDAIPQIGIVPLLVNFTDRSTGSPTSWQWNFGDNSSNSTLPNPSHVFTNIGIYNVTLTASRDHYNSTKTKSITVMEPVVANFSTNTSIGEAPLSVNFTDKSTGSPTSWQWKFGDNSSNSTLQNPTHVFTNARIYNVTLTAMKTGSSSSITKNITVNDTTPPVIISNATRLWPPNHDYINISMSELVISAKDAGDPSVGIGKIVITSVSSDEPEHSGGSGETELDIEITSPQTVRLRAERIGGGNGRVYTVNYKVTDASGNTARGFSHVWIPPENSGTIAIDDGAAAGYTVYTLYYP